MHVCYPFEIEDFIGQTGATSALHPELTIVKHGCGRNDARHRRAVGRAVVHSPVRGKHVRMREELLHYAKFVGPIDPASGKSAADAFRVPRMRTSILSSPEATELAKLTETTYFGLIIAWAQEPSGIASAGPGV